jgi:flagellar basal body-associated protein FliL
LIEYFGSENCETCNVSGCIDSQETRKEGCNGIRELGLLESKTQEEANAAAPSPDKGPTERSSNMAPTTVVVVIVIVVLLVLGVMTATFIALYCFNKEPAQAPVGDETSEEGKKPKENDKIVDPFPLPEEADKADVKKEAETKEVVEEKKEAPIAVVQEEKKEEQEVKAEEPVEPVKKPRRKKAKIDDGDKEDGGRENSILVEGSILAEGEETGKKRRKKRKKVGDADEEKEGENEGEGRSKKKRRHKIDNADGGSEKEEPSEGGGKKKKKRKKSVRITLDDV